LSRNALVFHDKPSLPEFIATHGLNILSYFPQLEGTQPFREINPEVIDYSLPWDFFDGVSENRNACSEGGEF
jgi:hypothetical protein